MVLVAQIVTLFTTENPGVMFSATIQAATTSHYHPKISFWNNTYFSPTQKLSTKTFIGHIKPVKVQETKLSR